MSKAETGELCFWPTISSSGGRFRDYEERAVIEECDGTLSNDGWWAESPRGYQVDRRSEGAMGYLFGTTLGDRGSTCSARTGQRSSEELGTALLGLEKKEV